MASDLLRRQEATQATLDKYRKRPFDWKEGTTCVHMLRFHLVKMGHRPEPMPRIRSLIAAKRALAERGCTNTADLLDKQPGLMRISPAQMLLGDLAVVGSADGLGSVLVCAGAHKLLGWREDADGLVVLDVPKDQLDGVWRV